MIATRILLILAVLFMPFNVFALNVVWDAGTSFAPCQASNVNSATCTVVIGAVSNPILVCDVVHYQVGTPGTITMSYNGASSTQVGSTQFSTNVYHAVFYQKAPGTGSHSLVVNSQNTISNGNYVHCSSWANADQTSPLDGSAQTGPSTATSITLTVSTTTANIIVGSVMGQNGRTFTATAPAWRVAGAFDSQATQASATTSSMTLTTTSDSLMGTAFGIKSFVATAASTPYQIINVFNE